MPCEGPSRQEMTSELLTERDKVTDLLCWTVAELQKFLDSETDYLHDPLARSVERRVKDRVREILKKPKLKKWAEEHAEVDRARVKNNIATISKRLKKLTPAQLRKLQRTLDEL